MSTEAKDLLGEVADRTSLAEGSEGVRSILRSVLRDQPLSVNSLAYSVGIAVPVVASVRRELEKKKLLERRGGAVLTELGLELLSSLGIRNMCQYKYDMTEPLPKFVLELTDIFAELTLGRPKPDFSIDQSHVDPDTCIRRVFYMYEHGSIEGRDIVLIGDDDLLSLAIAVFADYFSIDVGSVTILDIDQRVLNFIEQKGDKYGLNIKTVNRDLRKELPEEIRNFSDVFFTDPPYTVEGIKLFTARGTSGLRKEPGKTAYISFSSRPPDETSSIFASLSSLGLAPRELIPGFNRYIGAQLHAGVSDMLRCSSGSTGCIDISIDADKIYTNRRRKASEI